MNVERMLQLADVVERSETYCQTSYMNECGTPACVAGHACQLSGIFDLLNWTAGGMESHPSRHAAEWLCLTEDAAADLFDAVPDWALEPEYATREEAAAEIRRMVREYQEGANG